MENMLVRCFLITFSYIKLLLSVPHQELHIIFHYITVEFSMAHTFLYFKKNANGIP
jgi:hypothetical protein